MGGLWYVPANYQNVINTSTDPALLHEAHAAIAQAKAREEEALQEAERVKRVATHCVAEAVIDRNSTVAAQEAQT